jgi:hypothetical protein
MQRDNSSIDRWLRFAPWAAAILAALCLIVLVARVAIHATSDANQGVVADTESKAPIAPAAKPLGWTRPSNDAVIEQPINSSPPTGDAHDSNTTTAPSTENGRRVSSRLNPPARELPSPNSKSRFEIHGADERSSADQRAPASATLRTNNVAASPEQNRGSPARDSSTDASEVLLRRFNRLPDAHGLAQTSFFGIEAAGRRFVYVLDRSGSMGEPGNKPLRAAKDELVKSLDRLGGLHQFVLIFYNQEPSVFAGDAPGRLPFATDIEKAQARNFVEAISAQGGTNHYQALAKAVKLNPDVIFLLTDGEQKDDLTADELADLRRMNRSVARIYVVQFASSPYASNALVRLAQENRGQHTYLDIRKPQQRRD